MSLRIISAEERLSAAETKSSIAVFGPSGVGKTSLLRTLPAEETVCLDLEAGLKSVQDWRGDSLPIRRFPDAVDIACLIGGANPAAEPDAHFSEAHHKHLRKLHPELAARLDAKRIVFVDSITDLTRQAMAWAQTRPEAISERTGKPDTRGAYGLLAREVIGLLKHLQHAPGRTVIFVGILERIADEMGRTIWQPQMEGGKAARELPGIVDEVLTLALFGPEPDADAHSGGATAWRHDPEKGETRRLVCRSGNPWGLPAKDRSGRLDLTEPPDLGALLSKINQAPKG
ncbi:MAG: ATP-binding protein [Paracoccaceae bacterium]